MHGSEEKIVQVFSGKAQKKDTTQKTEAQMGRWDQKES
jgi:hypothetical protein